MTEAVAVDEVTPDEAYAAIASDTSLPLVDVRTRAEWSTIGLADLSGTGGRLCQVEWQCLPTMQINPDFIAQLVASLDGAPLPERMFFICRSGARSMAAARAAALHFAAAGTPVHCTNVGDGFEGEPDAGGQRGTVNGWKARGLPCQRS